LRSQRCVACKARPYMKIRRHLTRQKLDKLHRRQVVVLVAADRSWANTAHSALYLCSSPEFALIGGMKKHNYAICGLFIIALAYFTFSGCETTSTGPSGSTAHLTVKRGPKLGSTSVLAVMVDGARVASLTEGHAYNGTLSLGQHVISVSLSGPTRFANPTKTVMAEKGQTYSFTAAWQGKHLILQ
jgi:hypothetical protein